MPLNNLVIEKDYFTQIQNRKGLMKAVDFDFQFNNITNYINNSIIPILKNITQNIVPGSTIPELAMTYLKNVGDGTTEWSSIAFNDIQDYTLSYAKLVQTNPCSVLATDVNQSFIAVTAIEAGQALISQNNNTPIWKKITGNNIEDRQIVDQKIARGSLLSRNFAPGILGTRLELNSITRGKVQINTIRDTSINNGAIDRDVLGDRLADELCGANGSKLMLWSNTLSNDFIKSHFLLKGAKNPPNSRPIDYTKLDPNFKIDERCYNVYAFSSANLSYGCIEGYQIEKGSLRGDRLFWQDNQGKHSALPINDMLADGAIEIVNLPSSYKSKLGL